MTGTVLYARSRALPQTVLALAATALLAVWAAHALDSYLDPERRVPVVALAPLLAAAAIGASLYSASDELDRTAVRPWWHRRLAHLLCLTALAAALLPLAVLSSAQTFGPPAMVRNVLGCTGLTAGAAVLLGARLSWLPVFCYVSAMYMGISGVRGTALPAWAWLLEPGTGSGAWATAVLLFALGGGAYMVKGARGTP
ncbi:hypothetical protein QNN03_08930 [Streptomyces sp. GXMU-J15]|uniref:ABC transporter n=1 Tax=Streptomyces fuscus TaxID=3048495 RepID=A0ABT7IYW1_9ACTN|nr:MULTISPECIES: hypothetical protein [Streptomyces]MDL2076558.1 hypothetical protein [Streptomyces fuscus]SBT92676.1 hypothetical protein GA0115233_104910 [Streptomyces sp. DI166]